MNIVVTGATSFVGTGAVKELLDRGHRVFAVLRENSAKADKLLQNGKIPENLTILDFQINLGYGYRGTLIFLIKVFVIFIT